VRKNGIQQRRRRFHLGRVPDGRWFVLAQIARFGWLKRRPVTGDTTDAALAALNRLRVPALPSERQDGSGSGDQTTLPSLLSVARADRWLKVDTAAAYR